MTVRTRILLSICSICARQLEFTVADPHETMGDYMMIKVIE